MDLRRQVIQKGQSEGDSLRDGIADLQNVKLGMKMEVATAISDLAVNVAIARPRVPAVYRE